MDDTLTLIKYAGKELTEIDDVLDLHSEKFIALRAKIDKHKGALYDNERALRSLRKNTSIWKFLIALLLILIVFSWSYLLIDRRHGYIVSKIKGIQHRLMNHS